MRTCLRVVLGLMAFAALWSAPPVLAQASAYGLNPGDVLRVSVWREEELSLDVLVSPDGSISFPLVGQVEVLAKSAGQVQEVLIERLQTFIPDPVVTVSVLNTNGNLVYIVGKVNRPGQYVMNRRMDVMQALAIAGGLAQFASENKVVVLRRGEDGRQKAIPFRYARVSEGQDLQTNIVLQSGDVVVVP